MRKLIVSFFLLAAAISCRKPLFDPMPRWMHEPGRYLRGERQEPEVPGGSIYGPEAPEERLPDEYLTAFHFPEGFPWRDSVTTGAELVLYKNGEEQLRLPIKGTPEPDRHRVVEGELWTDACENGRMTVSCNGQERFSFAGDELFRGFLVLDGRVHTLGQRQGQEGFCYRIDGEEVYSSVKGTILGVPFDPDWPGGAFSTDSTNVWYTYAQPVKRADGLDWEYHVMQGSGQLQTIRAGEVRQLYDIRVFRGDVYRCERPETSAASVRIVKDGMAEKLGFFAGEEPHLCKLVPVDNRLVAKGFSIMNGIRPYNYWLKENGCNLYLAFGALPLLELYRDTDGTVAAVFLHPEDQQRVDAVTLDQQEVEMPPGRYRMTSSRCATFRNGRFSAALTNADGSSHQVLHATPDSVWVDTYTFNGCFISLQIQ